jgi:MFS family permease
MKEAQRAPEGAHTQSTEKVSRARDASKAVAVLSSGCLLALMYTAVSPILSVIATRFEPRADAAFLAQMVLTTPSIGMMIGGIVSAWLVIGLGARRLLLLALGLYGITGAAGLLLDNAFGLIASRFALGMSAAAIATGATTLLAERYDAATRSRLIGYQSSAGAVAGLASTLAAGAIADVVGWRAPFAFYLVAWAVAVVAAFGLDVRPQASLPAGRSPPENARLPWKRLLPVYALGVALYAAVFMTTTQVPFLLTSNGVVSASIQSWVLAMASMWNAVGAALYGRVRDRIGGRQTFALSLLLMAIGHAVLGLAHLPILTAVGCAIAGWGAGLAVPHMPAMVLETVDGAARGRALGVMYSALYLGGFCNPLLIAPVASLVGRHGSMIVSAGALAAGCGLTAWLGRASNARSTA